MKKGDFIIAAVLLGILAWFIVPLFIHEEAAVYASPSAEITLNGKHYRTMPLSGTTETIEIRTSRGYNVLRVSSDGIEMIEADCPDQLCIGFGHVHEDGDTIVCLPNRIFVEIVGGADSGDGADAVVS